MSKDNTIKTCRYSKCKHSDKKIDLIYDSYKANGNAYYHADCYAEKIEEDKRREQTKICWYIKCKHNTKEINIETEEYVRRDNHYFHRDCYTAKINGEWKDDKTKADLQTIKNLWVENISNEVVFSDLFRRLNELVSKGIDSEYLVFVMMYIINHRLNLNYPAGFKYFVEKREIKEAYAKRQLKSSGKSDNPFVVKDDGSTAPKFSVKSKSSGFQSILNHKDKGG